MTNSWFKVLLKEIILSKNHIFSSYFIRFFISTWDKIQKSKWSKFVFFVRHQNSVVVPGHKITGRLSLTPFWYQLKWQLFLAMRVWTEMPVVTSVMSPDDPYLVQLLGFHVELSILEHHSSKYSSVIFSLIRVTFDFRFHISRTTLIRSWTWHSKIIPVGIIFL